MRSIFSGKFWRQQAEQKSHLLISLEKQLTEVEKELEKMEKKHLQPKSAMFLASLFVFVSIKSNYPENYYRRAQ